MPLETGTYVNDLVVTNPPGTDLKSQGDDHLTLIKRVLKNTFPNATRAFPLPTGLSKTSDYAVSASDQNALLLINTNSGTVNLSMPTLLTADEGWSIRIIKIGINPLFIFPPSGFIVSGPINVTKARRNVSGIMFSVVWVGGTWWCERVVREPVGTVIQLSPGMALPVGYEFASGQSLPAASYPEFAALVGGVAPDLREKVIAGSTNLGGTIGLITPARCNINPGNLGYSAGAGTDGWQMLLSQMPSLVLSGSSAGSFSGGGSGGVTGSTDSQGSHSHGYTATLGAGAVAPGAVGAQIFSTPGTTDLAGAHAHNISGTATVNVSGSYSGSASCNLNGSNIFISNMPPTFICHHAVVVE